MPHEQPWLNDYQLKCQEERNKAMEQIERVFRIQNNAMRVSLRECPIPARTRKDCETCGNEPCVMAWKEQNELWKPEEDGTYPEHPEIQTQHVEKAACHAQDTSMSMEETDCGLFVKSCETDSGSGLPHGRPVSGFNSDEDDKDE